MGFACDDRGGDDRCGEENARKMHARERTRADDREKMSRPARHTRPRRQTSLRRHVWIVWLPAVPAPLLVVGVGPPAGSTPVVCGGSRRAGGVWLVLGGVLLSRTLAGAVPSALGVLASGFGMGPGVGSPAVTTETSVGLCVLLLWCPPRDGVGLGGGLVLRTAWWTRALLMCVCCLCWPISAGRLVGPCGSSTSGLSTQWSAGGLPPPLGGGVDTLS